ncbi:MAG: DNA gyrase subunit A, partial [Oscillospiraceae bacterium]|nr:DNA gyrase subunit A [Oscillospiraceae bacterium]
LRHILDEYLAYQKEIITRRTQYDLRKAEERQHVLQGLLIAEDNIDAVIKTIRESYDDAKERLMERFSLSEIQAQVVLDMQLKRLQGLEREKLEKEYEELEKRIAYYKELLASDEMLCGVLKEELLAIREKFGDERVTEIQDVEDEIDIEDLIEEEQCVFTMSHTGYIKRVPAATYRSQRRGGRGITGQSLKEEDFVETVFSASTHDYILFFTNIGKVHRKKGYQIPEAGRTARGTNIVNILPLEPGEKVTAGITVHDFDEDNLLFVTKHGTVKRVELSALHTARKAGIRALSLVDDDELIAVMKTNGENDIILATADGMAICFNENDVRIMGRDAAGVRGIALSEGDYVVGAGIAGEGKQLLTVTELGYGKRTEMVEYMRLGEDGRRSPQLRGGKGLKNYNLTAKTGRVAGVAIVDDDDDVMLIESGGVLIRMAASDINVYKRDTQGVILMRIEEGNRVISITRVDREEDEETETAEQMPS